jgi:hypothetical protein
MSKIDFNALRDRAYKCACDHGFHNTELSNGHLLMLVITELSEAVEADRKGKYFKGISTFEREFNRYSALVDENKRFECAFEKYVKDTVSDEMADAVIRLLDLAGLIDISLEDIYDFMEEPEYKDWDDALKEMSFTERMFFLTSILTEDRDIAEVIKASIVVIFLNADLLYVDFLWHIEQKMRYNELRENKHGKRY